MKLVEASLNARKDRESSFHQWAGAVKVVQSCLSASKDRERRKAGGGLSRSNLPPEV